MGNFDSNQSFSRYDYFLGQALTIFLLCTMAFRLLNGSMILSLLQMVVEGVVEISNNIIFRYWLV